MNTAPSPAPTTMDFPMRAAQVLANLRIAISEMFVTLPAGVRKSYDVNKLLGVDARLSWQIFKLTGPGDALSLAPHVPLPAAMQRLLRAAAKHGMDPARIDSVRSAFDAFENLVAQDAGDRSLFDTMTRSVSDEEAARQSDLTHRKSVFRAYRHILGAEVETNIMAVFNHPTDQPGIVDVGNLQAKLGLRRLRADSEMIVDNSRLWNADGAAKDPLAAGKDSRSSSDLLPEFCTSPLPAMKFAEGPGGDRRTMLAVDAVGRQGAVNLTFGKAWRNVPFLSPDATGKLGFGIHLYINSPTQHTYVDVMVPREIFATLRPSVEVYGFAPVLGDIEQIKRSQPRLNFFEKIVPLSGGVASAQIRDVPQYLKMINAFCERMNWRPDAFEVFRLSVEFPIMGSLLSLRFNQEKP